MVLWLIQALTIPEAATSDTTTDVINGAVAAQCIAPVWAD